jgi:hypothetical protein
LALSFSLNSDESYLPLAHKFKDMDAVPWVTITHTSNGSALQVHPHVFGDLRVAKASTPQFVVFIGKREKSNVLREILQGDNQYPQLPHGQVYLWPDPETRLTATPTIFVDCELHSSNSAQQKDPISYTTPELSRKIAWLLHGDQATICTYFTSNVLLPMSTVLYYFATDLGGKAEVAKLLANQLSTPLYTDIPQAVLPSIVIVADSEEDNGAVLQDTTNRFTELVVLALKTCQPPQTDSEARETIYKRFGSLQVVSPGQSNKFTRSKAIKEHIHETLYSAIEMRRVNRHLFTFNHFQAFSVVLLEKFCSEPTSKFSFIKASRPQGFHGDEFTTHLKTLLTIIPSEAWLWHFVTSMVASCLLLSLYPPDSHRVYIMSAK